MQMSMCLISAAPRRRLRSRSRNLNAAAISSSVNSGDLGALEWIARVIDRACSLGTLSTCISRCLKKNRNTSRPSEYPHHPGEVRRNAWLGGSSSTVRSATLHGIWTSFAGAAARACQAVHCSEAVYLFPFFCVCVCCPPGVQHAQNAA